MNIGDVSDSPWGDEPPRNTQPEEDSGTTASKDENSTFESATPAAQKASTTTKSASGRTSRTPRRAGAQSTRLEALDDDLGPLGPLGGGAPPAAEPDEPPQLPQKEYQAGRAPRPAASTSLPSRSGEYDEDSEDSLGQGGRYPPPVESQTPDATKKQTQPSMSVEQAARPTFNITVGDPHKVGGATGSHTVYQVRTKTTSKAYRQNEFEVSRRYRDFLWLYDQLHKNNAGIIVPPPPEKQSVGRFESDFVEGRRSALERMLNKAASHLILQHDADLKIFLESESFNVDVKAREKKDPDLLESKGMFSGLSLGVGSSSKFVEHDDWFLERKVYLDTLETQLKALLRSLDAAIAQRKSLSEACGDLSTSLSTLAQVELSPSLSAPLASLSDLQIRVRDLYSRQAQQDVLTLANVIDEYIRIIGSIKKAFEQRQRSWQNWHNAESDLQKRRSALDKLAKGGRTQQDRISQLQADVGDAERRAHQARLAFEDLGKGLRGEIERFEKEKVEDFRAGVETYLESSVEAQKELIECWETFLMHMDADEETAMADLQAIAAGQPPPSQQAYAAPTKQQAPGKALPSGGEGDSDDETTSTSTQKRSVVSAEQDDA